MRVTLQRVSVTVARERAEEARAAMLALFPAGFEEVGHGSDLELVAYTDAAGEGRIRELFADVASRVVRPGWDERWREFHRGVALGPLWVGPPWQVPPRGLTPVVIDPARAFGTGAHETTRLCVSWLTELPRGSLLDIGCGSGVLSIAAAKLGFAPVVAIDTDAAALEATAENALANGVPVDVREANALAPSLPAADSAVANIALSVVSALGGRLRSDRLVASGYLRSVRPRVSGFRHVERRTGGDWAADLYERG